MTPVLTAKTAQSASPNQGRADRQEIARFDDLVMLIAMLAAAATALSIGNTCGQFGLALGVIALLLVYRDGRPIALDTARFAAHHLAFGRMPAFGRTGYRTPQADFLPMLMHAMYVIVQSGRALFGVVRLRQSAIESSRLTAVARSLGLSGLLASLGAQQTASAGVSMANIVSGAQRVNQVIGEIATFATQQTLGITQVSDVVTDLDPVMQRFSAVPAIH